MWAHVVIDPIRSPGGELIGFAKITRDITERRSAQEALEEARARAVQSQKMEAIGQLTGGIAHDFNNLLAVVLGNLEMARKQLPDDPKLHRLIANSMRAAERGATLTRRMLAFARRQQLHSEPVEVPQVIGGMSELLQRSIGPAVLIKTRFPIGLSRVMTDANQLELALLNLTVNARDAMPEGGVITISAREREIAGQDPTALAPGNYVGVCVSDTGVGMDERTLEQATEPFFTTKGVGKGTGLGLSMVHGFAQQSGGAFVLRSTKGQGTSAELWLPVADSTAGTTPLEDRNEEPPSGKGALRILVVDDDSLVLMNTTALLEDLGHIVLEASSAEQALSQLRHSPDVDLVITDHIMPGMKGAQLVEAIKSDWPTLPVLLATGYAELQSDAALTVPLIAKPFTQRDLARAMAMVTRPS
jgi:signal transduction histidine kinase